MTDICICSTYCMTTQRSRLQTTRLACLRVCILSHFLARLGVPAVALQSAVCSTRKMETVAVARSAATGLNGGVLQTVTRHSTTLSVSRSRVKPGRCFCYCCSKRILLPPPLSLPASTFQTATFMDRICNVDGFITLYNLW